MLKNRANFIIATYEGVKVDLPVIVDDLLRASIQSVVDGKKAWGAVAQWLTLFSTPDTGHQTKEIGPTNGHKAKQTIETVAAPIQTQTRMDGRGLVSIRDGILKPTEGAGGESFAKDGQAYKDQATPARRRNGGPGPKGQA